jgi:hypothetical protein
MMLAPGVVLRWVNYAYRFRKRQHLYATFLGLTPQVPLDEFAHPRRFPLKLRDEQVAKLLPCLVLAQSWQCAA